MCCIVALLIQTSTYTYDKEVEEALKRGYVECRSRTFVVTGAAGVGKSHTLSLILNQDPPEVRHSTGILDNPVRAISYSLATVDGNSNLIKVDEDGVINIVSQRFVVHEPSESRVESTPFQQHPNNSATVAEYDQALEQASEVSRSSAEQNFLGKLATALDKNAGQKCVGSIDLIYFLDSGGQPEFQDILPAFVPNLSANIFVINLAEMLSDHPKVEYYVKGKPVSSYKSKHTHEEILKQCVRALNPGSISSPQLVIVGTHCDLVDQCTETINKKNEHLLQILQDKFGKNLIFHSGSNLIFPVNAKTPNQDDRHVTDELKKALLNCPTSVDVKKIPLPWFALEQVLQSIARQRHSGVMKVSECREIAERLHINSSSFDAALKYLSSLNLLLYYPDLIPGVIICNPQVILEKLTELVQSNHWFRGTDNDSANSEDDQEMQLEGNNPWLKFVNSAVLTEKLLGEFPKHYVYDNNIFTPASLLKLLEHLLIIAQIKTSPTEYIMPSLLTELGSDKLDKYRSQSNTFAAPLLVHFPREWPQSGFFSSLLASLLSPAKLEVLLNEQANPTCVHKNCFQFQLSKMLGKITLIDSFDLGYFEIHVSADEHECEQFCPQIKSAIFDALKGIRNAPDAVAAIFCPKSNDHLCSTNTHIAFVIPEGGCWVCSDNTAQVHGPLDKQQAVWFDPPPKQKGMTVTVLGKANSTTCLSIDKGRMELEMLT